MIKKRQVLVMVSIAVMSFLIGTMFSTNFMALGSNEYGIPFAKIWEAIDDLQARVTSLEESVDTKTWHLVTNFMALGSNEYGIPFAKIWEAIDDLQARVTSLEESVDTKTWHLVTSFTLSSEERVSQLFFIQGEKWRFKWEPEEGTQGYAFILLVFDEHDNAIEYFDSFSFVHQEPPIVEGVHYMSHGKGNYYLYVSYFGYPEQRESFTIESYH